MVVAARRGDFKVDALVQSQQIGRGSDGTFVISITPKDGFTGTVTLSTNDLPFGATATFASPSLTITGTTSLITTMVVDVPDPKRYTYNIRVTGTSGNLSRSTDVQLQVK
jgi:hypothetical protein